MRRVAALYVEPDGAYAGLPDVDVWDEERDARTYAGPFPVVAHPPCARWSVLAGLVEHVHGYKRGDDGGRFAAALDAVHTFGGVLEHPAHSAAFSHFGLPEPTTHSGWTGSLFGGWSAYVEQSRYGCPVRKGTWLYAYGVELPDLLWGYTPAGEDESLAAWRASARYLTSNRPRLSEREASATPPSFRDALLAIARTSTICPVSQEVPAR